MATSNGSAYKTLARQAVHDSLAAPVVYSENGVVVSTALTASLRARNRVHGDLDGEYGQLNEAVVKMRFNRPQLAAVGVTLKRTGVVTTEDGERYELDQEDPDNGPIHAHWSVVQQLEA